MEIVRNLITNKISCRIDVETTCYNCGKELIDGNLADDVRLAVLRFDTGDAGVGAPEFSYLECMECAKGEDERVAQTQIKMEKLMPPCCRGIVFITIFSNFTWEYHYSHTDDCPSRNDDNVTVKDGDN